MKFLNQGFDHVEFVVDDVAKHASQWKKIGFEEIGTAKDTVLLGQGLTRLLIKNPAQTDELGSAFLKAHGDGISVLAVEVEDAKQAFEITTSRGARPAMKPEVYESADGAVCVAEVYTPCDLR
jgi:4-hydroxyphenylpyruvate dioxygenase